MLTLKETLEILNQKANKSKKKYPGDAAQYSAYAHILKLLSKIAKQGLEPETIYQPQEAGKQQFKCKNCECDGYVEEWQCGNKTKPEDKIIKDCDVCKGEGFVEINVIDKRKKTKEKDLYYNTQY